MKRKEVKDLFQKYYNRFYRFQKQEWKKMWQEFLILSQNVKEKEKKPITKRTNRMVSYDIHGNKIEPDNPTKCPKCKTEINNVNMDIVVEESDKTNTIYECLECRQKIIVKN